MPQHAMNGANGTAKRPVRIAGSSGGVFDRYRAIQDLAKDPAIDVIVGDWMSEINMTFRGSQKLDRKTALAGDSNASFERVFIDALIPAIENVAKHKQKVAVNAGACDIEAMAHEVQKICKDKGTDLKVAWVEGDEVTEAVKDLIAKGEKFPNLPADKDLTEWGFEPICAQCYLGAGGIAEALRGGADIVICGRVADASPTVGAAWWWHNWDKEDFTELAHALVAGHLIECSTYTTGGYYTGFKDILNKCADMGFPIAEVEANGEFQIAKEINKPDGIVTVGSCLSQMLYEIQGPYYYNSDVTAQIDQMKFTQVGEEAVRVTNVIGHPPPPTTKVGITAKGGWQAEFHYFLTGLDIEEKCKMVEIQTKASMGEHLKEFHTLVFTVTGSVPDNPQDQDVATVDLRIFAQTRNPNIISAGKGLTVTPSEPSFARWCLENCLQGYPGSTMALDMRQAVGKPYFEYWVALLPQTFVDHKVHHHDGRVVDIAAPTKTKTFSRRQPSYDTKDPLPAGSWGETVRGPLGWIVHGRSGDKSSDCNVGFFVRHEDEWDWLRSTLSIAKIRELLGPKEVSKGAGIDRFEMPHLWAVHFLLRDHLDRGCNSSSSYDTLGKNCCEYLRAKYVDIPKKFLDRGKI